MSFRKVVVVLYGFDSLRWFQQCLSLGGCEEVCGVVCRSHTDRTFGTHTCPYDVLVSYKHDTTYDVSQYPSGFGDLCCVIQGMKPVRVILSSTNSSARRVEAYSVYHLFQVFFQCPPVDISWMMSALDFEGHLFHSVFSFCLLFSLWLSSQQHLYILGHF